MGRPPSSPTLATDAVFDLESPPGLAHEPFFAALANLEGHEGSPEWRATVAGLVVLRLVDRRTDALTGLGWGEGSEALPKHYVELPKLLEATGQAVNALDGGDSVAQPLHDLLQAATSGTDQALAHRLLGYAQVLHADARWSLAADVYSTILRFDARPRLDALLAPPALSPFVYDRLGHALRMKGDLNGATAAYTAGRAIARELGDFDAEFRLRISQAMVMQYLGNLPAAAAALDSVIQDVEAARQEVTSLVATRNDKDSLLAFGVRHEDVLAVARHDRGLVAADQRDFGLAIESYFAAWRTYMDPIRRERVWLDMARTLAELGLRDAARDAHLALYASSRRRDLRLIAATNLLELAVLDDRPDEFHFYREVLKRAAAQETLPASLAAWAALYEALGAARFGQPSQAVAAFEHALAIATQHRVNEVIMRADGALARCRAGQAVQGWQSRIQEVKVSPAVERITQVVRRVRRRAGVTGAGQA